MSGRDEILGLGPFQKELDGLLARLSKEDLCRILAQHGKTIRATERRPFLALFHAAPPLLPPPNTAVVGEALIADIRAFVADLEAGKYYEGTEFDQEIRDYRSYGDESWVDTMEDLFEGADAAFLDGDQEIAAQAYGLLLHAFDLEEDGHFCGATCPTEMVATDLTQAKARYLRALYGTASAKERPIRFLEELYSLRYRGLSEFGLRHILDAEQAPLPQWNSFLGSWIVLLRKRIGDDDTEPHRLPEYRRLLREAVRLKEGVIGLEKLARQEGRRDPTIFHEWLDELIRQERKEEAERVAARAMAEVVEGQAKACLAERWASLVRTEAELLEARRTAWRSAPTTDRLLLLQSANSPEPSEMNRRMNEEARFWRDTGVKLGGRLASLLLLLAGQYEAGFEMLEKANSQDWFSLDHPGPVVYPFLLLAVAGDRALSQGGVLSLWRHELAATDRVNAGCFPQGGSGTAVGKEQNPLGIWAAAQSAFRHAPLTDEQRKKGLELAEKTMLTRVRDIVDNQQRGSYDQAARMAAGWIEAATVAGFGAEATALLDQLTKAYTRRPLFRRELAALLKP